MEGWEEVTCAYMEGWEGEWEGIHVHVHPPYMKHTGDGGVLLYKTCVVIFSVIVSNTCMDAIHSTAHNMFIHAHTSVHTHSLTPMHTHTHTPM